MTNPTIKSCAWHFEQGGKCNEIAQFVTGDKDLPNLCERHYGKWDREREGGHQPEIPESEEGFWLASEPTWETFAAFPSEIQALRYAVDKGLSVKFLKWGQVR